ncbi:MAG: hypothetical protein U9Q69_02010 [Nanoarchaeota archaeon]|nr:hypothetical protein [Nanoarchaeota archaeon]
MQLIGILDTASNRNRIEFDGKIEQDEALVKKVKESFRSKTFREVIKYMLKNVDSDEKVMANEIHSYIKEHNGITNICEIRPYNQDGQFIQNDSGHFISLEEPITPYITQRDIDGENFDCIEMVLDQITAVGKC